MLEKCVHFLSSKSVWLRLLVLDTIKTGIQAISQSEDQLLPIIHRIWPPLVKRFTDDEQVNCFVVVVVVVACLFLFLFFCFFFYTFFLHVTLSKTLYIGIWLVLHAIIFTETLAVIQ